MCACVHLCMGESMDVYVRCVFVCMCVCIGVCKCVYVCMCMYVCVYRGVYVCV